jgi:hypothetical protein
VTVSGGGRLGPVRAIAPDTGQPYSKRCDLMLQRAWAARLCGDVFLQSPVETLMLPAEFPSIPQLHDRATVLWHAEDAATVETTTELEQAIVAQHRANFELWHIEDEARTPLADDRTLALTKRAIDRVNQRRNDLAEQMDRRLLEMLERAGLPDAGAELHTESPGLMIDRLSILALKLYHTREELRRADAPAGHAARNRQRLEILMEQRGDLEAGLVRLWAAVLRREKRFKVYQQLKMYNDPTLNPAVYGAGAGSGANRS